MAGNLASHENKFENYLSNVKSNSKLITTAELKTISSYLEELESGSSKMQLTYNIKRRIATNGFFLLSLSDGGESKSNERTVCVAAKNKEKVRFVLILL